MNYFKIVFFIATAIGIAKPETTPNPVPCGKGYVVGSDQTCLPYVTEFYGDCSDDAQCEWLGENSECNYFCKCKEGYRWYKGQCVKYVGLGETCSESDDCYDGYNMQSLTCSDDKKCICSEGYYQRGNIDCRKIAPDINAICALDIDCQVDSTDTVCHIGKCKLPEDISDDDDEEEDEEEIDKPPFMAKFLLDTLCDSDSSCSSIPNSECNKLTGTCTCQHSYFFNENHTECIAELGVDVGCKDDHDCPIKPGKCDNGTCYCRDYYFVAEGNRECVKTFSQKNWNCLSREWCFALGPYGYCFTSGTCNCSQISDLDEEQMICNPNGQENPDRCTSDLDCKYISNGYCLDEKCGCKDGGVVLGGTKCLRGLGSACNNDTEQCELDLSECIDQVCQCKSGYVASGNRTICYPQKDKLGDECNESVQCVPTYSICNDGVCECNDDRIPYSDFCYLKTEYGSYCNNRLECSLSQVEALGDSIECRNRKCQCPTGYTKKENECSSGSIVAGNFIVIAFVLIVKTVLPIYS